MSDKASRTTVVITSECSHISEVQEQIVTAVKKKGCEEKAVFSIQLALEEALANAIHHGNCDDPNCQVTVEYTVDHQQLIVSIIDEGKGFRPDQVADPTLQENLDKPNGRGVLLMKSYMDEVTFNQAGNKVTMVKKFG